MAMGLSVSCYVRLYGGGSLAMGGGVGEIIQPQEQSHSVTDHIGEPTRRVIDIRQQLVIVSEYSAMMPSVRP